MPFVQFNVRVLRAALIYIKEAPPTSVLGQYRSRIFIQAVCISLLLQIAEQNQCSQH